MFHIYQTGTETLQREDSVGISSLFFFNSKLVFGSYVQWNGLVTISAVEHEIREHAV